MTTAMENLIKDLFKELTKPALTNARWGDVRP
jgi:hypothetical protein